MGRAHEKSSQSMLLFLMQKNQITCIKNEVMVILLIEKVIDNKMFPKSTAGLYISDSYQRNFISHRHRIFYGLKRSCKKTAPMQRPVFRFPAYGLTMLSVLLSIFLLRQEEVLHIPQFFQVSKSHLPTFSLRN